MFNRLSKRLIRTYAIVQDSFTLSPRVTRGWFDEYRGEIE